MLEGLNEQGKLPEGISKIPGLVAVDAHTVTLKTKTPVDPDYIKNFLGFEVFIATPLFAVEISWWKANTAK